MAVLNLYEAVLPSWNSPRAKIRHFATVKRVVMAGAGHAHLYTLKRSADFTRRGFEIILVTPDCFWYSGLATGMLGGFYDPALDQIDAGQLIQRGGGKWIRSTVTQIIPGEHRLDLENGESLEYDLVSLNVGSLGRSWGGSNDRVIPIKPIANLARLRAFLERSAGHIRIVVAGAGASGCEIAANIRALARQRGIQADVVLLCSGEEPLPGRPMPARKWMGKFLRSKGIQIETHSHVSDITPDFIHLDNGGAIAYDLAVDATGLKPPSLLRESGLPVDADGGLLVNNFLQSTGQGNVFGGGDCVTFQRRNVDRVGVYAIREAPILHHNLLASLLGQSLRSFKPQKRYLQILNLGDGSGLATWSRWHWHGKLAFLWKDYLDRKFLSEYHAT